MALPASTGLPLSLHFRQHQPGDLLEAGHPDTFEGTSVRLICVSLVVSDVERLFTGPWAIWIGCLLSRYLAHF